MVKSTEDLKTRAQKGSPAGRRLSPKLKGTEMGGETAQGQRTGSVTGGLGLSNFCASRDDEQMPGKHRHLHYERVRGTYREEGRGVCAGVRQRTLSSLASGDAKLDRCNGRGKGCGGGSTREQ